MADERDAVARQWAQDWDSPEDAVYDAPLTDEEWRVARRLWRDDEAIDFVSGDCLKVGVRTYLFSRPITQHEAGPREGERRS